MVRNYPRAKRASVDWYCPESSSSVASLASGAQVTAMDAVINNLSSSTPYGSGALVGLRLWSRVDAAALAEMPPSFVLLMLPTGMTVPTLLTAADRKAAEKYIWAIGFFEHSTVQGGGAGSGLFLNLQLGSVRRFDMNDRIVLVLVNEDATAFGAGAQHRTLVDAYVRED